MAVTEIPHQPRPLAPPRNVTDVACRLQTLESGLRAVRAGIAAPQTRSALALIIGEVAACRQVLVKLDRPKATRAPAGPRRPAATATPAPAPPHQPAYSAKNRTGDQGQAERHCPRHDGGAGAWLPLADFDIKGKTGKDATNYRYCCRACFKDYQRDRYVAAGKHAIIVEVLDGDEIVGVVCNGCGKPFEIGQYAQGDRLRHKECGFS